MNLIHTGLYQMSWKFTFKQINSDDQSIQCQSKYKLYTVIKKILAVKLYNDNTVELNKTKVKLNYFTLLIICKVYKIFVTNQTYFK